MKTITAATELEDTAKAVTQIIQVLNEAGDAPMLIKVSYTEQHDPKVIADGLATAFPEAEIIGGSTHAGLFTESGVFGFGKPALGAFAVWDNEADIGVAMEPVTDSMDSEQTIQALTKAIDRAQEDADRVGELPDLIWIYTSPGLEETSIATIADTFGDGISVVGMSVADNGMTASWSMFDKAGVASSGIGIALFYTTEAVSHYIQSGFMPTGQTGTVTEADGRGLISIDGRPAREVFEDWCGHPCVTETGQVSYEQMGLASIAHRVGESRMNNGAVIEDYYLMSPVLSDGSDLTMVANPHQGEKIYMMRGEKGSMHNRLRKVTQQTLQTSSDLGEVSGGLVVMCAGYAMAMQKDAITSIESLIETFDGVPMLGTMGYGEQGTFPNGKCIHGNWMVSSTILSA
ncbi:MAG: FIST N-terminal domain-containing protein [Pseudomonadota bacterium]